MFATHPYLPRMAKQFVLAVFAAVLTFGAHAQSTQPCKAQIRANRGKALVFENLNLSSTEWDIGNNTHITRTDDSIHIQQNGATLTRFKTEGSRILGTRYQEFYPNGGLKRVDSLSPETYGRWHEENYFNLVHAFVINTRTYYPDGIPESIRHYRRFDGKDSLYKTWHPNGALQQTVWAFPSGTDSAVWDWNREGILYGIRYEGHSMGFYPTGILQSSSVDTVIGEQPLTCRKAYHPNGTLRSVEYEWQGIPYLTWLYYNNEGVLVKRVPHTPPNGQPWLPDVIEAEEPPMFFTYVDQLPEFPGGEGNLKKYLNEKLAQVTCDSPLPLQGKYEIQFTVTQDGTVRFQSLTGIEAQGIMIPVNRLIQNMPRWKPGKIAGRTVSVTYTLTLGIIEKSQESRAKNHD